MSPKFLDMTGDVVNPVFSSITVGSPRKIWLLFLVLCVCM